MPTLSQRLRGYLSSPQGKRLIEQGQRQLTKPENQQRVKQVIAKLRAGRTQGR